MAFGFSFGFLFAFAHGRIAGENYSARSQGYDFAFVVVINDLKAYQEDPHHVSFRDQVLAPVIAEPALVVDYDFPRSTAKHHIGREVATPEMQRWGSTVNADLEIVKNRVYAKGDAPVWRMAVAARPVRSSGYAEFLVDLNPKPNTRGIEIGIVGRADLDKAKEPGFNFTNVMHGVGWQCNGGFVSGMDLSGCGQVPHKEWEHDHSVGVYVDVEKGVVQFFLDRKKIGPALHLKTLPNEVFFAVAINTGHAALDAKWTASCPKVFIA